MKVLVAGATGVLGHRLVEQLVDRGHEVHGLVRDDEGAALVEDRGGVPRRGDVLEPGTLEAAVDDDVDVVVHAATAIPTSTKPSDEEWARNDRVRLEGGRNLLSAADDLEQFLFPSVVWIARQPDGSAFDESAERHPDRATESAAEVEDLIAERGAERGFDAAVLRCGFLYSADSAHVRTFGEMLLAGRMPVVGGGPLGRTEADLSFVHSDDAARALADGVEARLDGVYHVVDDEPASGSAVFGYLADLLDAPRPRRIPAWLARLFVGKVNAKGFSKPMSTTNEKLRTAVGWEPEYPSYREGLEAVVATWLEEGALVETEEGYEWTGT